MVENLYSYIFWHNPYQNLWYAIHKDSYVDFFGGNRKKSVYLSSGKVETLIELIQKPNLLKTIK